MYKWIWNDLLKCYCAEHNPSIRADKDGNVFGGGGGGGSVPEAPSGADAVEAWARELPQIYQAQIEYEPQLLAHQLAMQEEMAGNLMNQYLQHLM